MDSVLLSKINKLKPKPISFLTGLNLSESTFQVGTPNVQDSIATLSGATVINDTQGGSYIANQLAVMADEVWCNQNGENACKYSNDLTQATPWPLYGCTHSRVVLDDGRLWNLVTKTDATASRGIRQAFTIPSSPVGYLIMCTVRIPTDGTGAQSFTLNLTNSTHGGANVFKDFGNLQPGKTYRLHMYYTAAEKNTWVAGDTLTFYGMINSLNSYAACTVYVRDVLMCFYSPECFSNYVPTGSTAIAAGSTVMTKCDLDPYQFRNIDAICSSSGGNDCTPQEGQTNGVNKYSWYRSYDKLIAQAVKRGQIMVIGNRCPLNTGGAWDDANDQYLIMGYDKMFTRLQAKWNCGVDIRAFMKSLTASGQYTVSQLMTGTVHPNGTSAPLIAQQYINEITKNRKPMNNAQSELSGSVRVYMPQTLSGSWTLANETLGYELHKLGVNRLYTWRTTTQNDYILWTGITAEQLHILTHVDVTFGAFTVIIDEGTAQEIDIPIDCSGTSATANYYHGHFVTDFLSAGTHTVKIKVTSTGKLVKIHGIVAI